MPSANPLRDVLLASNPPLDVLMQQSGFGACAPLPDSLARRNYEECSLAACCATRGSLATCRLTC